MKHFLFYFKRLLFIVVVLTFTASILPAQVAINEDGTSPDNSAMLDVKSTDKGLLPPRLTTSARNTLTSIAVAGLMVYDTDLNKFFYFNGTIWEEGSVGGSLWERSGTNTYLLNSTDFVGIGTNTPARTLDVWGPWKTARLSSTSHGSTLEFFSTTDDDWAVTTWDGNLYLLNSTDDFVTKTDEYQFSTSGFYPLPDNARILGAGSNRWSIIYGYDGNFTDDVIIGDELSVTDKVGIGTTTPARKLEVSGSNQLARLTSSTDNGYLEFLSNHATDWEIGTDIGSMRMRSSTDGFTTATERYFFGMDYFHAFADNARTLGIDAYRWENLYSYDGNFKDDVTVSDQLTVAGNVGIGTVSPSYPLHISTSTPSRLLYLLNYYTGSSDKYGAYVNLSNAGTGTRYGYRAYVYASPTENSPSYGGHFTVSTSSGTGNNYGVYATVSGTGTGNQWAGYFPSGNVYVGDELLIGTTTGATGYLVSVDGKIMCEELRVDMSDGWPDYVFGKDYKLKTLQELDAFIQENGHLPNIPSAEKIDKSGIEVGEMQRLMMEKIEELSLYVIQQQKEIEALKEQINKNQK